MLRIDCRATSRTAEVFNDLRDVAVTCPVVQGKRLTGAFSDPSNSVSFPLLSGSDAPEAFVYQMTLNCPIGAEIKHCI